MTTKNAAGEWNIIDWNKIKPILKLLEGLDVNDIEYWKILSAFGYDDSKDVFIWEDIFHCNLPMKERDYLVEDEYHRFIIAAYDGNNNKPCFWFGGESVVIIRWAMINR